MRPVPPDEFRFLLKRSLQTIPHSVLRDILGSADRRARGLDAAADIVTARFDRLTVYAPDPLLADRDAPDEKLRAQGEG